MDETCELYRHFNNEDVLLYVGISLSSVARLAQHREQSPWFDQIRRVQIEVFPTRCDARAAEVKAIKDERPKYNVVQGTWRPPKFKRVTNHPVREIVDPLRVYTYAECAKLLGIKSEALDRLFQRKKIGFIVTNYLSNSSEHVIEFKGQNIIDYVELEKVAK